MVAVRDWLGAAQSARTQFIVLKWCPTPARCGCEVCDGLVGTWPGHPMGAIPCDGTEPPPPGNVTRSLVLRSVEVE